MSERQGGGREREREREELSVENRLFQPFQTLKAENGFTFSR